MSLRNPVHVQMIHVYDACTRVYLKICIMDAYVCIWCIYIMSTYDVHTYTCTTLSYKRVEESRRELTHMYIDAESWRIYICTCECRELTHICMHMRMSCNIYMYVYIYICIYMCIWKYIYAMTDVTHATHVSHVTHVTHHTCDTCDTCVASAVMLHMCHVRMSCNICIYVYIYINIYVHANMDTCVCVWWHIVHMCPMRMRCNIYVHVYINICI